ncbi:di-heme oxidoredictase family protein [Thalassomonas sp. RHCl1]|uniref:di-heme oxidoredictase family protein n=1 Tax=Thalassomonas sp. RHCl1 TaxID=2995320 RepID=UPI00248BD02E|nr:di-heme oxidoredictase family protein [Thalassomonas sp. RHCl1]
MPLLKKAVASSVFFSSSFAVLLTLNSHGVSANNELAIDDPVNEFPAEFDQFRHLENPIPPDDYSEVDKALFEGQDPGSVDLEGNPPPQPRTANISQAPSSTPVPLDNCVLQDRVLQFEAIFSSTNVIRRAGLRLFASPMTLCDGYGDGPIDDTQDRTLLGNRPVLQNGQTPFLRLHGLDAQACLECHSIKSNRVIPATFAVGGSGASSASPFPMMTLYDGTDPDDSGVVEAPFELNESARAINPPGIFGAGGISLLAKEITLDLQNLLATAEANPGNIIALNSHGINFGTITCTGVGSCNGQNIEGLTNNLDSPDPGASLQDLTEVLIVRPFSRKGSFTTTRAFDLEATKFHMGMQPVEEVGYFVDPDGDGVTNELFVGELSGMSLFLEGIEPPEIVSPLSDEASAGKETFSAIGCADCHIPSLTTRNRFLPFSFPQVDSDPLKNIYRVLNLQNHGFPVAGFGSGVRVDLFSDLKIHDMGPGLAEANGNSRFTTARLWGVSDSAPYMHDSRALTLRDAILFHDGEGANAKANFTGLSAAEQSNLLKFLGSLKSPANPNIGL